MKNGREFEEIVDMVARNLQELREIAEKFSRDEGDQNPTSCEGQLGR
jgi:hypothetical protein